MRRGRTGQLDRNDHARAGAGESAPAAAGSGTVAAVLFACAFAAQSGQLALTPVLADVARDLGLSTSVAGQIRTAAAVVAAVAALSVAPLAARVGLRTLLAAGVALLAAGAAVSSLAHGVALFAAGQALAGAASAVLAATGLSAAAAWSDEARRSRVVAWALAGAPAAWVVAMPVIGIVAGIDWRLAFAFVVVAAAAAAVALTRAPGHSPRSAGGDVRELLKLPAVRAWAVGETLAVAAWSGLLVYAGALFVEKLGTPVRDVGLYLGLGAAAYIPGTFLARRLGGVPAGTALAATTALLGAGVVVFAGLGIGSAAAAVTFGALCFLAGARAFFGSSAGLSLAGDRSAAAMSLRAAAIQLGAIVGAGLGGAALALGGFPALAAVFASLFAAAAIAYARPAEALSRRLRGRATRPAPLRPAAARARGR